MTDVLRAENWLEIPDLGDDDQVLDLGSGGRSIGLSGAPYSKGVFVTSDVRHQNAAISGGLNALLVADFPEASGFDCAIYEPPQRESKVRVFELFDGIFQALKVGGRCWLAGRKNRGVESYRKRLDELFGNVRHVGRSGRTRVYLATKNSDQAGAAAVNPFSSYTVSSEGRSLTFHSRAGVFSADGFDPGSRFLARTVGHVSSGSVLDIGCGTGSIGISLVAGSSTATLDLVDTNRLAVWCAERNATANGIGERCNTAVGDLYAPLSGRQFSLIVSNPPFHEGSAVAEPLIEGAASHLLPQGKVYLVVMRVEPYLRVLDQWFSDVAVMDCESPYSVLRASGPGSVSPGFNQG